MVYSARRLRLYICVTWTQSLAEVKHSVVGAKNKANMGNSNQQVSTDS